jgi:hypothetical protein
MSSRLALGLIGVPSAALCSAVLARAGVVRAFAQASVTPQMYMGVFAPLAERRAATSTREVREGARGYWITGLSKSVCSFAATKTTVGGKGFKLEEH